MENCCIVWPSLYRFTQIVVPDKVLHFEECDLSTKYMQLIFVLFVTQHYSSQLPSALNLVDYVIDVWPSVFSRQFCCICCWSSNYSPLSIKRRNLLVTHDPVVQSRKLILKIQNKKLMWGLFNTKLISNLFSIGCEGCLTRIVKLKKEY